MKVSIITPCFNERSTIAEVVATVRAASVQDMEIIVVDDGSTDGTAEVLQGDVSLLADRIIFHRVNQGNGAALRSGFAAATGEVILVQDADLEYNPSEYPALLDPIFSGKADAVFGSRFMGGRPAPGGLLLAHGGEQISYSALEHVYEPESHGHGDVLQSFPQRRRRRSGDSRRSLRLRTGDNSETGPLKVSHLRGRYFL